MKGYVKIHRELLEHPIWTSEKFTRGQAWADLILKANAKTGLVRKRGHRIDLNRGDVGYSIRELSRQWDWSENKTRRFLNELEDDGMVTVKKTNVSSTITLVNYDMWQSDEWQMRRGDYSSNGAQRNEQTTRKRDPNNKENKIIRKKEESEKAHTTLDLNPFLIKYPRNDVEYSYERFKLNQQKKGVKSDDVTAEAAAFEMWLMSDLKYGRNLRAPEVNETVTRHCPNRHGFVKVLAKDEYKGVFCKKCDCQMVHKSELVKSELLPF